MPPLTEPKAQYTNSLIREKSPYLLQHAHNPVDWRPWGPEALDKARREDKCIFLSIGYSTCHWCHVMETESFEDPAVAVVLNEHFVPVKVDREERPDLDEIYMAATQLFTGRGGWPNSLWLLPDGRPWYAGTYFPPEDRGGLPGFKRLLGQLASFWRDRRADVERQAEELAQSMKAISLTGESAAAGRFDRAVVDRAIDQMRGDFDSIHGGFGSAPKFPPHAALRLMLHELNMGQAPSPAGVGQAPPSASVVQAPSPANSGPQARPAAPHADELLSMLTATLDAIARGGIRDHLGGGFHRYATDERWFVPHFEKMLYDNAQLAWAYARAWQITGEPAFRRAATDACDWLLRDMTDPDGAFYSALDADSEGVEGKFYVWTRKEIVDVLGPDEADLFCRVYGIEENGNFRDETVGRFSGANIAYLRASLASLAKAEQFKEDWPVRLEAARRKLLEARNRRVPPHRDDKVLADWNGLMIGALACAGKMFQEPRYVQAAARAAGFVLSRMKSDGRLAHSWRQGRADAFAFLDDYAFLADGLLELREATGDDRWRNEARSLADVALAHYFDKDKGGFFLTADDHEALILRSKSPFDQAVSSGNGVMARVLVRLDGAPYRAAAESTLRAFAGLIEKAPRAVESLVLAVAMRLDAGAGPVRIETIADRRAAPGQTIRVDIRLDIAPGCHINPPIELTLQHHPEVKLGTVRLPDAERYAGAVEIEAPLIVAPDAAPGEKSLRFLLRCQACDNQACRPRETLEAPVSLTVHQGP